MRLSNERLMAYLYYIAVEQYTSDAINDHIRFEQECGRTEILS